MPLGNESTQRRYLSIEGGKLIETVNGAKKSYTHVTGHLVNVNFRKVHKDRNNQNSEIIGNLLQLHIIDAENYFVLQMWYNGRYAKCFYNTMENLSHLHPASFIPSEKKVDNKVQQSLFIKQQGQWIKFKYTKETPGDLPPLQETWLADPTAKDGQKKVINDDLQMAFFLDKIETALLPALQKKMNPYPNHMTFSGITGNAVAGNHFGNEQRYGVPGPVSDAEASAVDDLPF